MLAQRAHKLAFGAARGPAAAHDALKRLSRAALVKPLSAGLAILIAVISAAAPVSHPLTRLGRPGAGAASAGLQPLQPEALLKLATGALGALEVFVDTRLAAVLSDQADHDVRVIAAARRLPVADRDPPTLAQRIVAGKPHRRYERFGDL